MDTIYALATAPGKAGIAIIRLSGPKAHGILEALAGRMPDPRIATVAKLRDLGGGVLDQALILRFDAPASFTGEDVAELHLHGGRAVVASALEYLGHQPGLRMGEPGEFTRRAFYNGRLDLAAVEGLADLIDAETEAQRRQAMQQFSGALGKTAETWRSDLIRARALLEATIDFADEEVPEDVSPEVTSLLGRTLQTMRAELQGFTAAERIRDGFEVAIVGPPNAGKSTLLNAIAGRDAALISDIPGTTRDIIEVRLDLEGLAVTILDTAGLRDADDRVEAMGVARARGRAQAADLRIHLSDRGEADADLWRDGDLVIRSKCDLRPEESEGVSGLTGEGVPDLMRQIGHVLGERTAKAGSVVRERHRVALVAAIEALELSQEALHIPDLATEHLRAATGALDSLVGRVDVEHILDDVFANFCLGK